jgi:hypothetical protein
MDGHYGVAPVVLAAEHLFDLAGFDVSLEHVERALQVGIDRLAGLSPLDEHTDIVRVLAQVVRELPVFLQPSPALKDLLCVGLVVPEVGRGGLRFYLRKLRLETGEVKDSSADRLTAWRGPGSV